MKRIIGDENRYVNGLTLKPGEEARLTAMLSYERAAADSGFRLIAGIDEAGRGPLAGPVVSAAVILPPAYKPEGLNDSKLLSAKARDRLIKQIHANAIAWGVGICDSKEIDRVNILKAAIISMERAVNALSPRPDYLLTDALELKNIHIQQQAIIKGDRLSLSIAAASVIAKVIRDRMMVIYDKAYPGYGFAKHKGYGTREHIDNIVRLGLCPIHRVTFCHIGVDRSRECDPRGRQERAGG
jgi:ribonuclease HII